MAPIIDPALERSGLTRLRQGQVTIRCLMLAILMAGVSLAFLAPVVRGEEAGRMLLSLMLGLPLLGPAVRSLGDGSPRIQRVWLGITVLPLLAVLQLAIVGAPGWNDGSGRAAFVFLPLGFGLLYVSHRCPPRVHTWFQRLRAGL